MQSYFQQKPQRENMADNRTNWRENDPVNCRKIVILWYGATKDITISLLHTYFYLFLPFRYKIW